MNLLTGVSLFFFKFVFFLKVRSSGEEMGGEGEEERGEEVGKVRFTAVLWGRRGRGGRREESLRPVLCKVRGKESREGIKFVTVRGDILEDCDSPLSLSIPLRLCFLSFFVSAFSPSLSLVSLPPRVCFLSLSHSFLFLPGFLLIPEIRLDAKDRKDEENKKGE